MKFFIKIASKLENKTNKKKSVNIKKKLISFQNLKNKLDFTNSSSSEIN
jgi:hypothetical protein